MDSNYGSIELFRYSEPFQRAHDPIFSRYWFTRLMARRFTPYIIQHGKPLSLEDEIKAWMEVDRLLVLKLQIGLPVQ